MKTSATPTKDGFSSPFWRWPESLPSCGPLRTTAAWPSILICWQGSAGLQLLALCGYSFVRRSLTPWIFAGMLLGAELGHELGQSAASLQVLSGIFLKLVKTIVAPLIFSTLVVGIASHSNLKQVGRMGIKALLYFELVTTVALFIGLGAINLHAGRRRGSAAQRGATSAAVAAQPQKWTDIVLHIFPENIAKSVAEGQMLQIVVFSVIFGIALAQIGEEKRRPMWPSARASPN